ncbi:hypothetical protein HRW18_30925 [Streptomyces lunaelactis]|uniref:hypothetical protein n=1 Tax=Streptomyces lunaelactis TaxID=1535768 RepID=UPI0015854068|nr:hypothetical protein [Streptomyces lunaelactis]NUK12312.1 hypothetical protein [Streptomyces lunaelactis]
MTSTRAINTAAGVIHACLQQGKTIPTSIAYALDSACLLNSSETAAELENLRKRVAELEAAAPTPQKTSYVIEMSGMLSPLSTLRHASLDAAREPVMRYLAVHPGTPYRIVRWDETSTVVECVGELPEALHASSGAVVEVPEDVTPQVRKLRALLAGQRETLSVVADIRAAMTPEALAAAEPRIVAELLAEDSHDSQLHHPYRLGRDLPEQGVRS